MNEREIIVTPMTNAIGYAQWKREEVNDWKRSIDINRDFPFNWLDNGCFSSLAARVVSKVFTENIIVGCLTYHGGTETISYPWGSFNHIGKKENDEAPDFKMFDDISIVLWT